MAVISKDLGAVTAYAAAVNRGYTGTKEEFETLMASYATVAQQAAESAGNASQSATNASQSATDAETAKGTAQQAATDAQAAHASAQESAQSAQQSAQSASQSAQTAESAKETAVDAVDGFAAGAQQALDSVNQAGNNWKSLAQAQALDSEAYALGTRDGEDVGSSDPAYHNNAKWYAEQGGASAQTASDAAQTATIKASEASASASQAAESARTLTIDATLTQSGQAADAKKTGDKITGLKEELTAVGDNLISNSKHLMSDTYIDLFDKNDADFLTGEGYSGTSGTIAADTQSCLTGYIPVVAGEVVKIYYNYNNTRENFLTSQVIPHKIGFYNSAKEWMKTVVDFSGYSSGELTIEQTGYIRIHYYWLSAYLEIYKNSVRMISVDSVKNAISSKELLTGNPINWLDVDSADYLVGYGYSGTTGTIVEASEYSISNYVQVHKGKKLSIPYSDGTSFFTSTASSNYRKIAYYDKEKQWIKTISFFSTAIPFDSDSVDLEFDGYIRIQFTNIYTPVAINIEGFNEIGDIFIGKSNVPSKWYAIGDSITDGRYSYMNGSTATTGTDHTAYYGYIAGELLGLDVIEQGYGGLGFISTAGDGTNLTDILATDFKNPTLITVCLGINDMGATTGDANSTALDGTWSGAVRNACEVLGAKYPNAQIVFLSPINANNHGSQATIWSRKATARNNLDAQREILKHWCDVYNYKFIDMTVECPINVFNIVSLFPDRLHPSKTAHKMIGRWLAGALPFRNS